MSADIFNLLDLRTATGFRTADNARYGELFRERQMAVMTAALVMGLPMVVPLFDFEGSAGMTVAIPVCGNRVSL